MGCFHAKVLRDLGYDVVTVDPDPNQRADYLSLDFALGVRFGDRDNWRSGPRAFDVAAIACPPEHLVDSAFQLAGTPMLVEKPFAMSVREAAMLAAYLERRGAPVCVGLVERFNPVVRGLRALLHDGTIRNVERIHFTRMSDRPSFDVGLDLRLHDVDLVSFLGGRAAKVTFATQANQPAKVRTIEITHGQGTLTVDLMAHTLSPLHGLWHAFLTDGDYPKPEHVIRALEILPHTFEAEREATAVAA
jgi:predicted dehydrogenase